MVTTIFDHELDGRRFLLCPFMIMCLYVLCDSLMIVLTVFELSRQSV